jgi:hypothetical protein
MYLEFRNTRTNTVSALSVRFDVQSTESKWIAELEIASEKYLCLPDVTTRYIG